MDRLSLSSQGRPRLFPCPPTMEPLARVGPFLRGGCPRGGCPPSYARRFAMGAVAARSVGPLARGGGCSGRRRSTYGGALPRWTSTYGGALTTWSPPVDLPCVDRFLLGGT